MNCIVFCILLLQIMSARMDYKSSTIILAGIVTGGSFIYEIIPKYFKASVIAASFSGGHFGCLAFSIFDLL